IAILLDDPAHLAQIQQILKDAKAAKSIEKEETKETKEQVEVELRYTAVDVLYPQRIANAMQILYPKSNPKVSNGKLYVVSGFEQFVESLSKDPIIGAPWKVIVEDVSEEVINIAAEYLGIDKENYTVKTINEKLIVTIFASQETYKRFLNFLDMFGNVSYLVRVDDEYLKRFNVRILQSFSDGTKLVSGKIKEIERLKKAISEDITTYTVQQLPTDPSPEIFSKLTGTVVESKDGLLIFTVSKSRMESLKREIEQIRKSYSVNILVLEDKFSTEEKDAVEKIYGVKVYNVDDKIIIYGNLANEARNMLESLANKNQVIELVQQRVSDGMLDMLKSLFKINIYNVGNAMYIVGSKDSVEQAKKYILSYTSMEVSTNVEMSQSHIEYISKVYNVQVEYFQNIRKARVSGFSENVQKAISYISSLGTNDVV
ncbi:MAG: hypothetical protein N2Z58_09425, partial [Fervidobacterium sp.]|nr:hypothetical protein [Fervidobacterium sp.]